jgi:hypothetical protein
MFNPLVDSLEGLSDSELDLKISELSRKYFQSQNPQVRQQISTILEMYKEEAHCRRARQYQKIQQNTDNGLDSLIKIS